MPMSSPHEADQIHAEQLGLSEIYSCKEDLQASEWREYIGKQVNLDCFRIPSCALAVILKKRKMR